MEPSEELPVFVRIPSYHLGNVGDEALVNTLRMHLDGNGCLGDIAVMKYECPTNKSKKYRRRRSPPVNINKYRGMIYFANDCLAYYDIDTSLCQSFLTSGKPVVFINCSYGPSGTTKNDAQLKTLLCQPNCHLIARDYLSQHEITTRLQPVNQVSISSDLAFSSMSNLAHMAVKDNMLYTTPIYEWWTKDRHRIANNGGNTLVINLHEDFKTEENNRKVISSIQTALSTPGYWLADQLLAGQLAIIFLSHDSRKPETKVAMCVASDVHASFDKARKPELKKRVLVCPCLDYITELIMLRDGVDAVLTGRMHLSILAMRTGTPATAIAYNGIKAQGTFNHFGGIVKDNGVLTVDSINAELVDRAARDMLVEHRQEYLDCINTALPKVQELSTKQVRTIMEVFKN